MQQAGQSRRFTRRGFVSGLLLLALWRTAPFAVEPQRPESQDGFVEIDGWILRQDELA